MNPRGPVICSTGRKATLQAVLSVTGPAAQRGWAPWLPVASLGIPMPDGYGEFPKGEPCGADVCSSIPGCPGEGGRVAGDQQAAHQPRGCRRPATLHRVLKTVR
jgi:hypothetical protein